MTPTALITGASQGSGRATALLFASKGYDVAIAARQPERLEAIADEIRALGRRAIAIPTDVGDPQQVEALISDALTTYAHIDVLVNNAGICLTGSMEKTTLQDWQQIMATNFWGYVYTIQALLPHLLAQGHGHIVNVGSFGGKMPLPNMTAYCASKYAVTGLTETLQLELAPQGIQVCAVHPGVIKSSFLERALFRGQTQQDSQQLRQQMSTLLESSWVSSPDDIAKAVWEAIEQKRSEVVVGPVAIATEAYRLFPRLIQWTLGRAIA
ncbi:MAG: SDR family oxidoreductase [Cyanothece sp. SIO1E1]|nr:SDR family oxidoreductase [Cyanothece sp. SIO1E1]